MKEEIFSQEPIIKNVQLVHSLVAVRLLIVHDINGIEKSQGKKPSVIDLYIAESKGLTSGRPSVFHIYPLFQWRFTSKPGLVPSFARANRF